MFSDAVLRDSNTLSPSHTGQAMRCGDAPRPARPACSARRSRLAPTASSPTTTSTSSDPPRPALDAWSTQRHRARCSPRARCSWAAEAVGGDPRDDRGRARSPSGSMIHVSGTLDTPKATAIEPSSSYTTGQSPPSSAKNVSHVVAVVVVDDRVQLGAVGAERVLLVDEARRARGAPAGTARSRTWKKLSTTQLPLRRAEVERRAVGERRRSAAGAGWPSSGVSAVSSVDGFGAGEHDEQPGDTTATASATNGATARRRPRRRPRARRSIGRVRHLDSSCRAVRSAIGRRHRVGRPAPAAAGERGQQRADGHHRPADPQPHDHRLDEHADRRRRGAGRGAPLERQVDVLGRAPVRTLGVPTSMPMRRYVVSRRPRTTWSPSRRTSAATTRRAGVARLAAPRRSSNVCPPHSPAAPTVERRASPSGCSCSTPRGRRR